MPKTFKMTPRPYAHPELKWRVRIPKFFRLPDEKEQKYFKSKEEALAFARRKESEFTGLESAPELPAKVRRVVAEGLAALPTGHTLEMVFAHYMQSIMKSGEAVEKVCADLLAVRKKSCGKDTWDNYNQQLTVFLKSFKGRQINSFTTAELDVWLSNLNISNQTRKHYRTLLWGVFNFAGVNPNPLSNSTYGRMRIRRGVPKVYSPEQMTLMLNQSWQQWRETAPAKDTASKSQQTEHQRWHALTVGLALGAFAHIRPFEALRIKTRYVDLKGMEIRVTEMDAKNKSGMRSIRISDNLKAWLKPLLKGHADERAMEGFQEDYDIFQKHKDRLLRLVNTERNEVRWIFDGLRHSSCSYFLKHFNDRGRLIEEMGHRDGKMMVEHYRNAMVSAKDAAAWWRIFPPKINIPLKKSKRQ
ncbi:MAG: hypothetical protein LBK76_02240 [Verrucomicrobiales bacterium]|jgi:integrase|nr:hypothetical protein [Verrucomicrobiales bacterium]